MKKRHLRLTLLLGILAAGYILLTSFDSREHRVPRQQPNERHSDDHLLSAAFDVLDSKCNVCHRKQNPFMVFNKKNMIRRSSKIYRMVFVERRMPKGSEIRLTTEEAATLEKWLFTQEIF